MEIGQHGLHRGGAVGRRVGGAGGMDQIVESDRAFKGPVSVVGLQAQPRMVRPVAKPRRQPLYAASGGVYLDIQIQAQKEVHQRRTDQSAGAGDQDTAPVQPLQAGNGLPDPCQVR